MLSTEEVRHIAHLARIGIEEDEAEKYRRELSAVLESFEALQSVDVSGVPAAGLVPGLSNAVRSDKVTPIDTKERDRLRDLFPQKEGESLRVKSVF